MEYISASEASEKWGVSLRQVQRLLAENRIPRAKKYGRSWMIPGDAEKPADPRRDKTPAESSLSDELARVLAATTVPMPIDHPDAILSAISEKRLRLQYEGELAYLRGNFGRTLRCFREAEGDDAVRLRVCPVAIAAAICTGDYASYAEIDAYLKGCVKAGRGSDVTAYAELALSVAAVCVIIPGMAPDWLKEGDFSALPAQARLDALYMRVKYLQCLSKDEAMLAAAQTGLSFCASEQGVTFFELYLRLMCAVACYTLGRADEARRRLLETMRLCLPNGFISLFAEYLTPLGGLVEQCLEQSFPEHYDAVLDLWKRTWKNWITFHNQFAKGNITLMLSLREYHIALLVSHRVPYAKIAQQHCISVGRVKNIMLDVYGKLCISGRDELSKYVF